MLRHKREQGYIAMATELLLFNYWGSQAHTPATVRFALAGGGLKLVAAVADMRNTGDHDLRLAIHRTKHHK